MKILDAPVVATFTAVDDTTANSNSSGSISPTISSHSGGGGAAAAVPRRGRVTSVAFAPDCHDEASSPSRNSASVSSAVSEAVKEAAVPKRCAGPRPVRIAAAAAMPDCGGNGAAAAAAAGGADAVLCDIVAARGFHVSLHSSSSGCAAAAATTPQITHFGGNGDGDVSGGLEVYAGTDLSEVATVGGALADAKRSFDAAEAKLSGGLVHCEDWMRLRDEFHACGALFSLAGLPDDAARALLRATFINRAFKDDDEALATLNLSVAHLKQSHPGVAVESLTRLAVCYEKSGLFIQAARCLRDAAEIHDSGRIDSSNHSDNANARSPDEELEGGSTREDKESAIALYSAAMELYERSSSSSSSSSSNQQSRSRGGAGLSRQIVASCRTRLAYLHAALGHWDAVEATCRASAAHTPSSLPATRFHLLTVLAVLARGSGGEDSFFNAIYDTKKVFDALQEEDRDFQKGKENALVRALLAAYDGSSLCGLDLSVQQYREYRTTAPDAAFELAVEQCRANLFAHLEHYA